MSVELLKQAIASTRAVLANVSADQLDRDTPCASWKVRDVVNHVVGGQFFFGGSIRGESSAGDAPDFASGDFVATFDQAAAANIEAFSEDGAMARMVKLPFGDMPGAAWAGLAATDTFVHGWDLAKATGQDTDLSPELAGRLLAAARASIQEAFRGADGVAPFGAEQPAPDGASNADRLAAFLGRTV